MSFHTRLVSPSKMGLFGIAAAVILVMAGCERLPPSTSESTCEKLPDPGRTLCLKAIEKRNALLKDNTTRREAAREENRKLPEVAAASKTNIEVICKLRANRSIDCLPVSTMIAYLSSNAGRDAIENLNDIADLYEIRESIAVKCPDDDWTGLELDFSVSQTISDKDAAAMEDNCNEQESKVAGLASGILSGLIGEHPPLDCFQFSSEGYSRDEEMQKVADLAATYVESCVVTDPLESSSPLSSSMTPMDYLTEGSAPEEPPSGPAPDATVQRRTQSTTTNSAGELIVTTITEYSDGTLISVSTNVTTGESTAVMAFPGTSATRTVNTDSTGQTDSWTSGDYTRTSTYDADRNLSRIEDNKGAFIVFDTTTGYPKFGRDPEGRFWSTKTDPADARRRIWTRAELLECAPDSTACDKCQKDRQNLDLVIDSCLVSGGASKKCQGYLNVSVCCPTGPDLGGMPGLFMPNPEGELVCVGSQTDRCKEMCKYASTPIDCEQQCAASRTMSFQRDLIDNMCLYVMSPDGGVCSHRDGIRASFGVDAAGFSITPDFTRLDKGMFVVPPTTCPSGECALIPPPQ